MRGIPPLRRHNRQKPCPIFIPFLQKLITSDEEFVRNTLAVLERYVVSCPFLEVTRPNDCKASTFQQIGKLSVLSVQVRFARILPFELLIFYPFCLDRGLAQRWKRVLCSCSKLLTMTKERFTNNGLHSFSTFNKFDTCTVQTIAVSV